MYKMKNLLSIAILALITQSIQAQNWTPKKATLMTGFSKDVKADNVLPEYPRPQMVRKDWLNLNGVWQFQPGVNADDALPQGKLARTILVPFPVESALSGVMEHHERLWYKRSFRIPTTWKGKDVLLHFGAVDFQSEIFINGKRIGSHKGGYDPFSFNITQYLKGAGAQTISVKVYDPTDNGGNPRGKQSLHPGGIMYTSTTGIWQTVWLEPVAKTNIENIRMVPDIDKSLLNLTVNTEGNSDGIVVNVKVKEGNKLVKSFTGDANTELSIPVPNEKLWSPNSPFLYNIEISLNKNGRQIDQIKSYFGMRKIALADDHGYKKLYLNNKFLFELGPLDQGFWPDGIYTAPTDDAIKYDLSTIKKLGFNMVRKHIKVEPYRWYYWADKLGLLIWQDMPSANSYTAHTPPVNKAEFKSELQRMVETHWNSPSIIMWVIFNESQGQHDTPELVKMVKKMDPSRLVNQASGGSHFGVGDVFDIHSYPPPAAPANNHFQALACGEYGGIGYVVPDHTWKKAPTYIMMKDVKDYTNLYREFARDLEIFKTNNGLSAAVYTETTDVESELNGLMTYDRAIIKVPVDKIRDANYNAIHGMLYLSTILATSKENPRQWKYTLEQPNSNNWYLPNFDAANWKDGQAGFGSEGTPGAVIKTNWTTHDIWLRQSFSLKNISKVNRKNLMLNIHHDDACTVYINGVKAAELNGATSGYTITNMSEAAQNALHLNGENIMAIHCHQDGGGQYIDAGISIISNSKPE
ncbi:glycoside hydrolase family 2 [Arachidicoccus soli]|uniref:Glycoside hydrolase family 2 n=2 Tax=Arachidicoccus soli TaxID=2341117 RepID=A0A386HNB2_9BACT|nr:glycoside hydrolase family 2 [Arachidicoccus soli]